MVLFLKLLQIVRPEINDVLRALMQAVLQALKKDQRYC